jgi:signal transduction histidine kinase
MTHALRPAVQAPTRPAPTSTDGLTGDIEIVQRLAAVPKILSVCLSASGMGIVAIARVTADRWIACAVLDRMGFGLPPGGELPVETTLCGQVRDAREPIVIEHASQEAQWCDHGTPRTYGYESHMSVPIVLPDGTFFGTIVAIDPKPLPVRAPDTLATFTLFADLLAFEIDAERRLAASRALLEDARREAELRERFIAVLGHDLRGPLAVLDAGARVLQREEGLSERAREVPDLMTATSRRMADLIDDVLDFAQGRLAGGIPVRADEAVDLGPTLSQIVAEFRSLEPDGRIEAGIGPLAALRCDPRRVGQLASNLIANALAHGAADAPVRVVARTTPEAFELWVANRGASIPPERMDRLFEPFARGSGEPANSAAKVGGDGLGLGLYIAQAIARAHGGTLTAASDARETRFTFKMPLGSPLEPLLGR